MRGNRAIDGKEFLVYVSEPLVADRLRKLVAADILRTEPYREDGRRTRMQYRLTEKGLDLFPVLISLLQWGDLYCSDGEPALLVHERSSGSRVEAVVRPVGAGPALSARETVSVVGPGARRAG